MAPLPDPFLQDKGRDLLVQIGGASLEVVRLIQIPHGGGGPGMGPIGVKAHLAQYARLKPCADTPKTITVGPLTADPAARRITKNGVEVPLKNKEYELLFFLMRHPEQVFSREDLYELIWGLESMGDNITVAVHINRLREKIEDTPADPKLLQTVWGVGYRLHVV